MPVAGKGCGSEVKHKFAHRGLEVLDFTRAFESAWCTKYAKLDLLEIHNWRI